MTEMKRLTVEKLNQYETMARQGHLFLIDRMGAPLDLRPIIAAAREGVAGQRPYLNAKWLEKTLRSVLKRANGFGMSAEDAAWLEAIQNCLNKQETLAMPPPPSPVEPDTTEQNGKEVVQTETPRKNLGHDTNMDRGRSPSVAQPPRVTAYWKADGTQEIVEHPVAAPDTSGMGEQRARSSTVEPSPHERGVAGSNPAEPTSNDIAERLQDWIDTTSIPGMPVYLLEEAVAAIQHQSEELERVRGALQCAVEAIDLIQRKLRDEPLGDLSVDDFLSALNGALNAARAALQPKGTE